MNKKSKNGDKQTVRAAVSLANYLGRGVDLFHTDPWNRTFKAMMLDSPPVETLPVREAKYRETYADNLLKMSHELGVEAGLKGSYAGFSSSVSSKFQHSEQRSEKRHFLKISYDVSGDSLVVGGGIAKLKQLLNKQFRDALGTSDPGELFKYYGTHLAHKIRIGGRAEYFCQSSATSRMTSDEFKIAAKAKYETLGGEGESGGRVGGSSSTHTADAQKTKDVEGSSFIDTLGGSAESSVKIKDRDGWANWAKACEDLPGLLGFERDGLLPIWELVDDPARRTLIHEAYKRMAAKALTPQILLATSASEGHPEARVMVPDGYKLLSGGAKVGSTEQGNLLTASFPEGNNTWRANSKDHVKSSHATLTVFAIAIDDPDDIWEVKVFQSHPSAAASQPHQEISVDSDYVMVGGGAQVNYSGDGNMLFASYPKDKTTWRAQSKEHIKPDGAPITAYAIGLKCNVNGVQVQSEIKSSRSNQGSRPLALASPSSRYVMVGGGAALNFRGNGMLLTQSYPRESNTWEGQGKDHVEPDSGTIDAYCIGLKVVDAP
jgi:hypothetical protein